MFKKRKTTHQYLTRQSKEIITRSRILTDALPGGISLRSQLGEATGRPLQSNPNEDVATYYAASLSESPTYTSYKTIPSFVVDENNGAIIFAQSRDDDFNDTLHCLRPVRPGNYRRTPHIFEAMPNPFVDMSISVRAQRLFYASSGPMGTCAVLLEVPRDGDDPHSTMVNHLWTSPSETAWQTAASPTGESFAIASSKSLRHYMMLPGNTVCTSWPNPSAASGEYMAVAFGRDDRTIMGGKRSGIVTFFDKRTQDSVTRLRHEDAVSSIRLVDDNRLAARGLQKVRLLLQYLHFHSSSAGTSIGTCSAAMTSCSFSRCH
jgi:WD40 repeat protein